MTGEHASAPRSGSLYGLPTSRFRASSETRSARACLPPPSSTRTGGPGWAARVYPAGSILWGGSRRATAPLKFEVPSETVPERRCFIRCGHSSVSWGMSSSSTGAPSPMALQRSPKVNRRSRAGVGFIPTSRTLGTLVRRRGRPMDHRDVSRRTLLKGGGAAWQGFFTNRRSPLWEKTSGCAPATSGEPVRWPPAACGRRSRPAPQDDAGRLRQGPADLPDRRGAGEARRVRHLPHLAGDDGSRSVMNAVR